jgi:iron(III) transport system permease protein
VAALTLLVLWALPRLERSLPPLQSVLTPPRPFRLGRWRWPGLVLALALVLLLVGVPGGSLLWGAGEQGYPPQWSAGAAWGNVATAYEASGAVVVLSLAYAVIAGALAAGAGLLLCWLALDAPWFRRTVFTLAALLWALPAPVVGLGLKEFIQALLDWLPDPLVVALWEGPSPLPALWAQALRFLPCAVAVLWPVVRLVPAELRDSARVDGASPGQELVFVVWPLTARAAAWAALVIAALALGEVGAVMRVETPGWTVFAHLLWDQMHRGVGNPVAALCLLLLGGVGAGAVVVLALRGLNQSLRKGT